MIAFSGSTLDRASARRADPAWLATQRAHPNARILPLWQLRPFVLGDDSGPQQAGFVVRAVAESMAGPDAPWVLLGLDGEAPHQAEGGTRSVPREPPKETEWQRRSARC